MSSSFAQVFGKEPLVCARAPGRIEFIGNHTDYNGGLVMGVAVDKGVTVSLAPRADTSISLATSHGERPAVADIADIRPLSGPESWCNYVLGVAKALMEQGMNASKGFDIYVESDLPSGAGLSSSAALELSTGLGLAKLYNFTIDKATLARVGRKAENQFVGMPCGILDQGVSAFGEKDSIVRIDCAKESFSSIPMPQGLRFWVFNTMEKHNLVESLYATRHRECMDAFALLRKAGSKANNLAEVSPQKVRAASLPAALEMRALHVCEEHRRVIAMGEALASSDLSSVGRLLSASHNSSRTLFENSTEKLDALVAILDRTDGVIGARLTGGGFGGAAMALTFDTFTQKQADKVCEAFAAEYAGVSPNVFCATAGAGARLI